MTVVHDATPRGTAARADAGGVGGGGQYHGFVSEFMYGCNLDSWGTNSYINHVVAPTPMGPWRQSKQGVAVPTWSHNPRVVWSEVDSTWVMYHIGAGGNDTRKVKNCGGPPHSNGNMGRTGGAAGELGAEGPGSAHGRGRRARAPGARSSFPFQIHYASSLDAAAWESLAGASDHASPSFTLYPGVDNVAGAADEPVTGGVVMKEDAAHGNGTLYVPFANFTGNGNRLPVVAKAWDACAGAVYVNANWTDAESKAGVGGFPDFAKVHHTCPPRAMGVCAVRAASQTNPNRPPPTLYTFKE